jgi:ATP-dependent Clp protease ATP-binding subunit ClpC
VGKTELSKALAEFMFGSEQALIQLDMSEFMERHTASRLVGAPPGYVGYDEAGQLTEALRRHPYSIVVFDEVEKAHPEVHNMLLQIMEEGQLSDARGKKVSFKNAIVVMTSNIGADLIKHQGSLGFNLRRDQKQTEQNAYDDMRRKLTDALKKEFRPEFLNRLDGVIVFRALTREEITQIVQLEVQKLTKRVADHDLKLELTPEACDWIATKGYDPDMGARPLRRVIQSEIEDHLSDGILSGKFSNGDTVKITVEGEALALVPETHTEALHA